MAIFAKLKGTSFVLVTADSRQTTREKEKLALRESGVTVLYLRRFWSGLSFWDQAAWLVRRWPLIDGVVQGVQRGICAEVQSNGKLTLFHP